MEEIEEIMEQLDQESVDRESMEEKHRRLDEKLDEVHDQLAELNEHLRKE